jgi:magnesium transporter
MIEVYASVSGKIVRQSLHDLQLARSIAWIDLSDPTNEELNHLKEKTNIPLVELRHALDKKERSRVKITNEYTLIIYNGISERSSHPITPVGIFFTRKYVLTIHSSDMRSFDDIDPQSEIFKKVMQRGTEYLLYTLLFRMIKEYFDPIDKIDDLLSQIEEGVVHKYTSEGTRKISSTKTRLTYLHKSLLGNHEAIVSLTKLDIFKEQHMFDDLNVEVAQMIEEVELFIERLNTSLFLYLMAVSNRLNDVMRIFTIFASLLLIPTLVTGLYGMNVKLPLATDPNIFWMIVTGMIVLMAVMLWTYRFKKWI